MPAPAIPLKVPTTLATDARPSTRERSESITAAPESAVVTDNEKMTKTVPIGVSRSRDFSGSIAPEGPARLRQLRI